MLGPLLTLMGLKPVKFQSESEFAKSISTRARSSRSTPSGAVKGYKRETRVKIHTVVDFRDGAVAARQRGRGRRPPAPTAPAGRARRCATPQVGDADAITAALQPSIGGQVLYFDIE